MCAEDQIFSMTVQKRLGIKPGQTTKDMEYSLQTVACIGACALAPNISIDKETYGHGQ